MARYEVTHTVVTRVSADRAAEAEEAVRMALDEINTKCPHWRGAGWLMWVDVLEGAEITEVD